MQEKFSLSGKKLHREEQWGNQFKLMIISNIWLSSWIADRQLIFKLTLILLMYLIIFAPRQKADLYQKKQELF